MFPSSLCSTKGWVVQPDSFGFLGYLLIHVTQVPCPESVVGHANPIASLRGLNRFHASLGTKLIEGQLLSSYGQFPLARADFRFFQFSL